MSRDPTASRDAAAVSPADVMRQSGSPGDTRELGLGDAAAASGRSRCVCKTSAGVTAEQALQQSPGRGHWWAEERAAVVTHTF